jgi:DNA-binding MarR family transcriptional regulator
MLDRLSEAESFGRRPNPNDRRSTLIFGVEEKAEEIAHLFESARNAQRKLVSSYSETVELLSEFEQIDDHVEC